jgi:hypothetical protein
LIPNVFHFVFGLRKQTEPFHLMYYLCLVSCINVNQPDAVHFHYHHEPWGEWWERIKPHLQLRRIDPEQSIANYRYTDPKLNKYRYAHLADFARLQILYQEGGIYADIDTLFLRPLPPEWRTREFILGQEKAPALAGEGGSLCNAWIASAPGSVFARLWLDGLHEAFDGSWSNHSTLLPYRMWKQYPDIINVEPESAFYALDWTSRGIEDLFLRHTALPLQAYSLHLWNHLWFEQDRLDFSHFHADLLSLDYVLYANTTYANNARAHLPTDVKGSRTQYLYQRVMSGLRHPLRSTRALWRTQSIQGGRNF